MSKEDVAFLEKVMSEGIIDEGQRMKSILADLTDTFEVMLLSGGSVSSSSSSLLLGEGNVSVDVGGGECKQEEKRKELEEEDVIELLQELRDIVEQIDYARAFMAMGGLPFLLGIATHHADDEKSSTAGNTTIPKSIRQGALGVLSTMSQNNPPVQLSLLEQGHIPQLVQLFYDYTPGDVSIHNGGDTGDDSMREKIVQALSASIREHSMAEHIFCMNEQAREMMKLGLGMQQNNTPKPSVQLRKRSLFFIRALLTSDNATHERHSNFQDVISFICTHGINDEWEDNAEIREMSLSMLTRLLKLKLASQPEKSSMGVTASSIIMQHKTCIRSMGMKRIQGIGKLKEGSEERELAALELDAWEMLMVALAAAEAEAGRACCIDDSAPPSPSLAICSMNGRENIMSNE